MKACRNLVSGKDDELTTAYAHFHKMVEQEQGVVRNATLAVVEQVETNTSAVNADIRVVSATTKRTEGNTETLMAVTGRIHGCLDSKNDSGNCSLLASNAFSRQRS